MENPQTPDSSSTAPPQFPHKIAVLCDLRDEAGRVLMLHRKKPPNLDLYSPIGGKLETAIGESPAQCAQREIKEEAGLDIPLDRLHLGGLITEHGFQGEVNWMMFYYRVMGSVELEPFEMREGRLEWIEEHAIDELPLPETDRKAIWPAIRAHEPDGFFALHIDCTGPQMSWNIEQSDPSRNR
ncbi:MAG: NUDIX domain-containing protein [Parvularculaceae bacterium]|nr:NUDIX domain-containing protein [Parvularculaceae bacterium]